MGRLLKAASALMLVGMVGAQAHTITFGYENAGPGAVTFWFGSYHTHGNGDGPDLEGSLQLQGINGTVFATTTVAFTIERGLPVGYGGNCTGSAVVCSGQPAGLIDGVTNFADPNYTISQNGGGFLDVQSWQGVTFTGLAAGDYQFDYIPIANPSAHWAPWSSAGQTGTVTLDGGIVNGTPEPTSLALVGLGLLGMVMGRKRKA